MILKKAVFWNFQKKRFDKVTKQFVITIHILRIHGKGRDSIEYQLYP